MRRPPIGLFAGMSKRSATQQSTLTSAEVKAMSMSELKEELKAREQKITGTKDDLVQRLTEALGIPLGGSEAAAPVRTGAKHDFLARWLTVVRSICCGGAEEREEAAWRQGGVGGGAQGVRARRQRRRGGIPVRRRIRHAFGLRQGAGGRREWVGVKIALA